MAETETRLAERFHRRRFSRGDGTTAGKAQLEQGDLS